MLGVLDQPINILRRGATAVAAPLYQFSVSAVTAVKRFGQAGALNQEIARLQKEKIDLLNQIVDQAELQKENDVLAKALQFRADKKVTLIPARIFMRFKENDSELIGLAAGENQKLEKGDAVVTENGVVVGKVWQVDADTSKVLLLVDPKSKIGADIIGVDNFGGIVEGQYGLGIALTTIPHGTDIKPEAIVITSGLENQIPRGLLLGQVVRVTEEPRDPFAKAVLKNLVSVDTIHTVFVVKK